MSQLFSVVENNPNVVTGGGGCLCTGPLAGRDCTGPFVVFPATETESNVSPHSVLCRPCLELAYKAVTSGKEVLAAGEIDSTAELADDDLSL